GLAQGNSTILRHCFSPDGCSPKVVALRIRAAIDALPLDQLPAPYDISAHSEARDRIIELVAALHRYALGFERVAVLADPLNPAVTKLQLPFISTFAFLMTNQWYLWKISSPINDSIAGSIIDRILTGATDQLKNGDRLFVTNDPQNLILI